MILKLNAEAINNLEEIMSRTNYASHVHCVQVMLSQVMKKLLIADEKKQQKQSA